MTKWQNKMAKKIKPVVRNMEVSPSDADEIKEAVEEVIEPPPLSTTNDSEMKTLAKEPLFEVAQAKPFELREIEIEPEVIEELNPADEAMVDEEVVESEPVIEPIIEKTAKTEPVVQEMTEPEPVVEPEIVIPRIIETSVIHTGTHITGNIDSDDILIFHGNISGNINCTQKLTAYGNINGNITADMVEYHEVNQTGFITVKNDCIVSDHTVVQGNIACKNLNNSGTINGSIECLGTCQLNETAVVVGDIQTKQLSIKSGAIIKGKITMDSSEF